MVGEKNCRLNGESRKIYDPDPKAEKECFWAPLEHWNGMLVRGKNRKEKSSLGLHSRGKKKKRLGPQRALSFEEKAIVG